MCSGMQRYKSKFLVPDNTELCSFQSCIRTNDIEEVGDGTHLTSFTMVGSFGFGTNNYQQHCEMWLEILSKLNINIDYITYHPHSDLQQIWEPHQYQLLPTEECIWRCNPSDVGDFCCEIFSQNMEIGNLVNPNKVSIDVGFGYERLLQIVEGCGRVDETSLFDQTLTPIMRDHKKTIELLLKNNILPGGKGRNYICRKLLRRFVRECEDVKNLSFQEVFDLEKQIMKDKLTLGKRNWKKFENRPINFWWETFGILPEEVKYLRG